MNAELEALSEQVRIRQSLPAPAVCKALRVSAGVSLARVARAVGVTPQAVYAWEIGRARPSGENLVRYAEVLEILQEVSGP